MRRSSVDTKQVLLSQTLSWLFRSATRTPKPARFRVSGPKPQSLNFARSTHSKHWVQTLQQHLTRPCKTVCKSSHHHFESHKLALCAPLQSPSCFPYRTLRGTLKRSPQLFVSQVTALRAAPTSNPAQAKPYRALTKKLGGHLAS